MSTFSYPQYQKKYNRCKNCFKLMSEDIGLQQPICGAHYCPRCLCTIYKPHYLQPQKDIIIELQCGHYVDRQTVLNAILDNCINCGLKFDKKIDVEMKENIKLCRNCFDHDSSKFNEMLYQCMSCNRIIRLTDFLAGTQIVLCKECATQQSQIQTTTFSTSQANYKQQSPVKNQLHKKQSAKSHPNIGHAPSPPVQNDRMSKNSRHSSSSMGEDDLPQDISIVSRFSALEIEDRQSGKQRQGDQRGMKKVKLTSKHSMDIRVENLKINLPIKPKNGKQCSACGSIIADDSLVTDNENKLQCKICFMQNYDPRQSGFYRSFARTSVANQRDKHTSAPKNKGLLGDNLSDQMREMKKSMMSASKSQLNSPLPPRPANNLAVSSAGKKSIWDLPQKKDKLCEICQQKNYRITRVDRKKVCQDCYNK